MVTKVLTQVFFKSTRNSAGKMAGEEAPDKVKRENDIKYWEYAKIIKIERRLERKIKEDPGTRPDIPELMLPPGILEEHARVRCGACDPCKALDCRRCSSCRQKDQAPPERKTEGGKHQKGESRNRESARHGQRTLPPPSSWGTSSIVSEATVKELLEGAEKLAAQHEIMTEATTKLLAVVSKAPWGADLGLTESDLIDWLGVQENWVDELTEKIIRRERELVRLVEVEEDEQVPAMERPTRDTVTSKAQVSFRSLGGGAISRSTQDSAAAPARPPTPGEGGGTSHPDLSRFPLLRRRKAKLAADLSSISETVEGTGVIPCKNKEKKRSTSKRTIYEET